jgi:hypothetical protein
MGRPLKKIDPEQVRRLAMIQCTLAEMCAVLDCDENLLIRRFGKVIQKGKESGKASVRRMQYKAAQDGNVAMLIWLGKMLLGQKESINQQLTDGEGKPLRYVIAVPEGTADE